MTRAWDLAQVNVALMREPLDAPAMRDFVAAIEPVNALADASPGFLWRLRDEDGDATGIRLGRDDMLLVNLSTWVDAVALASYVYGRGHAAVLRRRREWFHRMAEAHTALWWVPAGHRPAVDEAAERLALLRSEGPGPGAFTLREQHPPPAG